MRELLVLLPDDADSASDVVLVVVALPAVGVVGEVIPDDLAGLELLAVQYLRCLGDHWEVLCEDGMPSDVREVDPVVRVKVEHLLEEVLDLRSAVDGQLLLGALDGLRVTKIIRQFFEFHFLAFGRPVRVQL